MPDTPDDIRPSEKNTFSTCWLETRLGKRYEIPDMTTNQVDYLCAQCDSKELDMLTLCNASGVVFIIPKNLVAKAGVNNRCFWEGECPTKLNPPGQYQQD